MKILQKNLKQGIVKVKPETIDDLWALSTLINKEDSISGTTMRRVTLGDKASEKTKVTKKPMFLKIKVEKIEFDNNLKLLGIITQGPDDIPHGSHHSFNVVENDVITIQKDWLNYQIKKLEELEKKQDAKIIACIYNREEANFAKLEKNKFQIISKIDGDVEKKGDDSLKKGNFFKDLALNLEKLQQRLDAKSIIFASSHFWKKNLQDKLPDTIKKLCIFVPINDCSSKGFSELLIRPELERALADQQAIKDAHLIEDIFEKIAKEGAVTYGFNDSKNASEQGAVKILACTEELIAEKREETDKNPEAFKELEEVFKLTESSKGEIKIISGKGEHVQKLNGLGGIAAILRFKI